MVYSIVTAQDATSPPVDVIRAHTRPSSPQPCLTGIILHECMQGCRGAWSSSIPKQRQHRLSAPRSTSLDSSSLTHPPCRDAEVHAAEALANKKEQQAKFAPSAMKVSRLRYWLLLIIH